ncbi:hypothetical protein [Micromonospora sp. KC721]|uniref:hypothetical protein n=1 Tax=Micromonospora sp. KC721 TaxID=2530380 RepID=UPI00105341D9|nr:hypothetical protein [Micromonospora sp. KC721]TDB73592.1 hypothetical protein E1182_20840 [Micromonospora sp. KC721]
MTDFRRRYGATAGHLLLLLGCFAVAGWVALRLAAEPTAGRMLLWFLGAVILHDLLLFPAYALVDRALRTILAGGRPSTGHPAGRGRPRPSALNHVRVPTLAAGLLLLVYLPGVLGWGDSTYSAATGLQPRPMLARWVALTGVLFAASAAVYVLRRLRHAVGGAGRAAGRPGGR